MSRSVDLHRVVRWTVLCWLTWGLWHGTASVALAERPPAPKLLPHSTFAYLRVADSRKLVDQFLSTSTGQLLQDKKIKPLLLHLYGSATRAFAQAQDEIGVSLSELLSIPQGEMWIALVGRDEGNPAVVISIEAGDRMAALQKLADRIAMDAVQRGRARTTEEVDGTVMTSYGGEQTFAQRDGVLLIGSDPGLVREVLRTWTGDQGASTLADNREFTAIMGRSMGTKDERPQVTWFVDPVGLIRHMSRIRPGMEVALAMLPLLGLDGVKAVGGSLIFAAEDFDQIGYIHILLDNPRRGLLQAIAVEAGDTTPEPWVPPDAAAYMTVNWNSQQTLEVVRRIVEPFRGENAVSNWFRGISNRLGVDFERDVLGRFDDRYTFVSWFEKPARVNSGAHLVGIRVSDAAAMRMTLEKAMTSPMVRADKENFRGITYWNLLGRRRTPEMDRSSLLRRPAPYAAVVGDHLLFTDSKACLEAAITAFRDGTDPFAEGLDFKLVASRLRHQAGTAKPGMIVFDRPEESMRWFYELATSPSARRRLEELAQTNQAFRALHEALEANPLPPFAEIAKYLAPRGGVLVSDATGLHYTTFALRRK